MAVMQRALGHALKSSLVGGIAVCHLLSVCTTGLATTTTGQQQD